ncbi:hypothetical protein FOL47_005782 [Perkinsus chesapeaki]|uniref:Uncharacterized protein n=1 Tax=Perkinsus chesapeaki TaxID=330153 RepID=A0A7J6MYB4_PERCH|nr:hypothetical protein FOL47_005782 [Perkinsus chesapeaki]
MRASILSIVLVAVGCTQDIDMFASYKKEHKLDFGSDDDYRFEVFKSNIEYINEVNSQGLSYKLGITPFTHLTRAEFEERMTSRFYGGYLNYLRSSGFLITNYSASQISGIPDTMNYVDKGWVTGVKNQGYCGSCWAFSTTGSLEAVHKNVTGDLVSLSEQELVSCSTPYGNQGCRGGLELQAFRYVNDHGLGSEKDYPYTASQSTCNITGVKRVIKPHTIGYRIVKAGSKKGLLQAVVEAGPVTVGLDGTGVFQLYKGGVLDSGCGTSINHGALLVGYNMNSEQPYYLVKNSWGEKWGEDGYIRIAIDDSEDGVCGILKEPSFPFHRA